MAAIEGVEIERNINGEITHVRIDVRQNKEAISTLEELGWIPERETKDHTVEDFYNAMVAEINKQYGTNH